MDWSSELKLRAFLIGLALFLISGCYSWRELGYSVRGKVAPAKVTRVHEYDDYGGRSPRHKTAVEFSFTDDHGLARQGKDTFDGQVDATEGDPIQVQYRAGADGDARVAGHANTASVYVFLACLIALAVLAYPILRETYDEVYAPKKRRR